MAARHTGHLVEEQNQYVSIRIFLVLTYLASLKAGPMCAKAERWMVVFTAANKHEPQQIWPQGVKVAFVG